MVGRMVLMFVVLVLMLTVSSARAEQGGPILSESFVRLGGIDQWVTMRGSDAANPVLLIVHGGPGEAQWPLSAEYAAWEQHFIIVQWDQRGAGRTFARNGETTPDVNLRRIAEDGTELVRYICEQLRKRKVIALGHSWGSIVAVTMVNSRPDLFAAYVGTGQVASWKSSVQAQFDYLLASTRVNNDTVLLQELDAIETPNPSDAEQYFRFTRGLRSAMPASDRRWLEELPAKVRSSTEVSEQDFENLVAGMQFSGARLLDDQMAADLPSSSATFRIPFFVIQGREDISTPTTAAVTYSKQSKLR